MSFLDLAKSRYSVRSFKSEPVADEKISKILEAGNLAPTALNFQPQKIYVIKSEKEMEKLRFVCRFVPASAPMAMIVCYDIAQSWKQEVDRLDAGILDATIVATHMMLEAAEEGVGTCFIRGYHNRDLKGMFKLPDNIQPVCILSMGYPSENSKPNEKLHNTYKSLDEIVEVL